MFQISQNPSLRFSMIDVAGVNGANPVGSCAIYTKHPHKFFGKKKAPTRVGASPSFWKDAVYAIESEILTCLAEGDQKVQQVSRTDLTVAVRIKWASAT